MTPVTPKERATWRSFTQVDQFLKCERQFFYERILRLPRQPSFYLSIGNLYHHVLEVSVEERIHEPDPLRELIEDLYSDHAGQRDWSCPTSEPNLKAELHSNLQRAWRELIFPLLSDGAELTVEESFPRLAKIDLDSTRAPVVEMGQVVGTIDEPAIIDYKVKFSTNNRRSNEDAAQSAQLAMYRLLKGRNHAFFFEIPRSLRAHCSLVGGFMSDEEGEYWKRWYTEMAAAINSRPKGNEQAWRLAAPDNRLCDPRWCSRWAECPGGGGKN